MEASQKYFVETSSMAINKMIKGALEGFLNEFVEPGQELGVDTNLFWFSSKPVLQLSNIYIKAQVLNDIFFNAGVPLKATSVVIGKLSVHVSILSIRRSPIKVGIEDVFVNVELTKKESWKEEDVVKLLLEQKETLVKQLWEELLGKSTYFQTAVEKTKEKSESVQEKEGSKLYFSSGGFVNTTLTRIIDNFEVELKQLTVRLEAAKSMDWYASDLRDTQEAEVRFQTHTLCW